MKYPEYALTQQGVYLLHFDTPYKGARHYIGFSYRVSRRVKQHMRGVGTPLTRAAYQAGVKMFCARVWWGQDYRFERKLHDQGNTPRLCPECNPKAYRHGNLTQAKDIAF